MNRDDPAASWFEAAAHEAGATVVTYGTDPSADVRATGGRGGRAPPARPLRGAVGRRRTLELRLAGRFNVHNALAVVALGEALGPGPGRGPRRASSVGRGRARAHGADRRGPAVRA